MDVYIYHLKNENGDDCLYVFDHKPTKKEKNECKVKFDSEPWDSASGEWSKDNPYCVEFDGIRYITYCLEMGVYKKKINKI
jgi:hypothetical protein